MENLSRGAISSAQVVPAIPELPAACTGRSLVEILRQWGVGDVVTLILGPPRDAQGRHVGSTAEHVSSSSQREDPPKRGRPRMVMLGGGDAACDGPSRVVAMPNPNFQAYYRRQVRAPARFVTRLFLIPPLEHLLRCRPSSRAVLLTPDLPVFHHIATAALPCHRCCERSEQRLNLWPA